jgi:hypothetical protein
MGSMQTTPGRSAALGALGASLAQSPSDLIVLSFRTEREGVPEEPHARLSRLAKLTAELGVPICVRKEAGERWMEPAKAPESRNARLALGDVWEVALRTSPTSISLSLAHAAGASVAAARSLPKGSDLEPGIGVDVERSGRPITVRLARKLERCAGGCYSGDPIGIWTLLEALYKADVAGSSRAIGQFRLESGEAQGSGWMGTAKGPDGRRYAAGLALFEGFSIALAVPTRYAGK